MLEFKLVRAVEQRGPVVSWINVIGPYTGQSGVWTFASEADAAVFAAYAKGDPAPPMNTEALAAASIPQPINRQEA